MPPAVPVGNDQKGRVSAPGNVLHGAVWFGSRVGRRYERREAEAKSDECGLDDSARAPSSREVLTSLHEASKTCTWFSNAVHTFRVEDAVVQAGMAFGWAKGGGEAVSRAPRRRRGELKMLWALSWVGPCVQPVAAGASAAHKGQGAVGKR